ncbi:amidase domain-containing protein [bacterium]|nr:amidase domain-containing protein [bacterium]
MAYTSVGFNPLQTPGLDSGLGSFQTPSLLSGNPALGRLGGGDDLNALLQPGFGGMDPNAMAVQAQGQMLEAMMMLLTTLMKNGGTSADSGSGSSSGGDSGATSAISGGSSASGGSSSSGGDVASSGVTGGGANASVEMAKKYLGNSAISLKGKLDNYSAAGGTGNDCADFVSAILANTQGFKKKPGDASVATFKQDLLAQGWRKVSKAESKAGDVVIFNGSQHTELVVKDGGAEAIGSNGGATNQQIKTDSLSWGSQEFFHKG